MALNWINLILLSSCTLGAFGNFPSLHVTYPRSWKIWNGYYSMPTTVNEAQKNKFVPMSQDKMLNASLYSYPNNPRVSIIFDYYKNIAGLRTCYIIADIGKRAEQHNMTFPYDFSTKPMYSKHTYWNTSCWCTSVLFISPEKLKAGGRKDTGGEVAEDIWIKLNGNYTKIAQDECDVVSQGFTKEACFVGMGMHYFYGMTQDAKCEDLQGVFVLYECGKLIGLGITPFGSFTENSQRTWNEDPPASIIEKIIPIRPECVTEWVKNYGTTSFHIFFKKSPRLTFCIWPWQDSNTCSVKDFINNEILD